MISKIKYEKNTRYTWEQFASFLKVSASLWTLLSFILDLGVLFVFFERSTGSLRERFPRNFWPLFQSELLFLKISRYLLAVLEYIGKSEKGQFFHSECLQWSSTNSFFCKISDWYRLYSTEMHNLPIPELEIYQKNNVKAEFLQNQWSYKQHLMPFLLGKTDVQKL